MATRLSTVASLATALMVIWPAGARSQTVVPSMGGLIGNDHEEAAVYLTMDGVSQRLAPSVASYPRVMSRYGLEGDVDVVCVGPGDCSLASQWFAPNGVPTALAVASAVATRERRYPLRLTVSFRVLAVDSRPCTLSLRGVPRQDESAVALLYQQYKQTHPHCVELIY